jgi:cytochrome P450
MPAPRWTDPGATGRGGRTRTRSLPRASVVETLQVGAVVVAPLLARGVIVRRPAMVRAAEALDADTRAVRLLQRLRSVHGEGPLRLRVPGRRMVVLLGAGDVHRVLAGSPEPFSPATREKRAALAHFQPHGVLISTGEQRRVRRALNEAALDSAAPVHRDADAMVAAVRAEVDGMLAASARAGELDWPVYARSWWRLVRRVVLGDGAREDEALTDQLRALRATANWAFLHPRRPGLRAAFDARLQRHLDRAEPGSLAASLARAPHPPGSEPEQQVPQWLFAFDAGAWASFRALALLATHPEHLARAREEVAGRDLGTPQDLPYLRACLLESLRLWPTTPAVLRETTERTRWAGGPMPAGTSVLTYAPFFHRDDEHVDHAHRFAPETWLDGRSGDDWPLIPFSAGPAECAGRNLVLHVTSTVLALLISAGPVELATPGRLDPGSDLPGTLDPFRLRFALGPSGR